MAWRMFAQDAGTEFRHVATEGYVRMCGATPVPVIVTETPDGEYYGWLHKDREVPSMIWRGRPRFIMCFPYGPEAEEERGKGRILRLSVEPAAEPL